MDLNDFRIYNIAIEIGEEVWQLVIKWDSFEKFSFGKQLTRSTDSIAANIAEGFGRFHYKDKKNFCYYARGSLFETKSWLLKASKRNLIDIDKYETLMSKLNDLGIKLNNYINTLKQ